MKIVIVNGSNSADYLVKRFKEEKHQVIIINSKNEWAEYISRKNAVDVYVGDPTKLYVLEDNNIEDANLFISLSDNDCENYVSCLMAKKLFHVEKVLCSVLNPKNVDIFKRLGIDIVISSTHIIGETIKNMVSISDIVSSLTFENSKIIISEVILKKGDFAIDKALKDLVFGEKSTISCIIRNKNVIIPKGYTILNEKDKILLVSTPDTQNNVINYLKNGKI